MKRIYGKTVRELFDDFIKEKNPAPETIISRSEIQTWFNKRFPDIKSNTVNCHIIRLSTNIPSRIHYLGGNISGEDDIFYSLSNSTLRLFDRKNDPAPIYPIPGKIESQKEQILKAADVEDVGSKEFAYEEDLKKYLAKNLAILEPGLKLYEDEGIDGIEYDAGGRYIDILAIDAKENFVVIELKVSRGYDRCVGQILRYINWIRENLAEPEQKVRGMIVCREITEDLILACKSISDIELFEYELNINVKKIK